MESSARSPLAALTPGDSIAGLVARRALASPAAVAIAAPDRESLTYGGLFEQISRIASALGGTGVGSGDRVAAVLGNGPEAAVAFLGVASSATFAPLNPAYGEEAFDFYLSDLGAAALILEVGDDSPARSVAHRRGIPVIELQPDHAAPAGVFELRGPRAESPRVAQFAGPDDTALVLHTSGTTSRPKIVPLRGGNLRESAGNVRRSLALTERDRCLNVMPLFHIHGLVAALLASVDAGASVFCTPGFLATDFPDWLERSGATWYTAVPTMHQSILARLAARGGPPPDLPLRFVRSSSASLPIPVIEELERVFGVPVIEAYGMTEAAHQMACNPLPPRARKPGSVGPAAGPEVAVMDDGGSLLAAGERGEVVIRGPNVTAGYENNPDANAAAFTHGWFRTGDEGYLDADGYLFLTGRLKEIINRGGEKIAPREVEDVLLAHADVAQVVVFAVPHPRLGEDIGAAVVRRAGAAVTAVELRAFAADRLPPFKLPRMIRFVPEIPKGATGKVQRIGMAERIRVAGAEDAPQDEHVPPRNEAERRMAGIWRELLGNDRIGVTDDFFELGGDSVLALQLGQHIEEEFGIALPMSELFVYATIEHLVERLDAPPTGSLLVPIQPAGTKRPFFCVHELFGDVLLYEQLARRLGPDQPFFGLQAAGVDGAVGPDVMAMAANYVRAMRSVQPEGPYAVGGLCAGGVVALEMAQQLRAAGEDVALVALLDADAGTAAEGPERPSWFRAAVDFVRDLPHWLRGLGNLTPMQRRDLLRLKIGFWRERLRPSSSAPRPEPADPDEQRRRAIAETFGLSDHHRDVARAFRAVLDAYRPQPYEGRIALFRARMQPLFGAHDPARGWRPIARGPFEIRVVPGNHLGMLQEPHVATLARELAAALDAPADGQATG